MPFDATFDLPVAPRTAPAPPQSIWFGPADAPLFGRFHAAGSGARDAVVVLCNPFGYDAGTTHYAYQKLAERLSRAGVDALRFDYFGTGNSAGPDEGPDEGPARVEAWLESIGAAVAEARRLSGASKVILFGARSGALLATVYAQESPVDGLILLGPPRSGSAFVRELLAVNKLRTTNPTEGASPDIVFSDDENLGFVFSSDLREAIAELDPRAHDDCPAPRALVIARDDVPGPEVRLVEHLRELGVDVQHSAARGYSAVFDFKALPDETIDEMIAWLPRDSPRASATTANAAPPTVSFAGFDEEAVRFAGLFGILTVPSDPTRPRETGILLLSSGANQHVGVNRMHVTLSRVLARLGFRVLRFDLSGIGESPTLAGQPDRMFYTPQAVPETQKAIDFMMSRGAKQVALIGVCSGGYTAFHTAVADARVAAILPANVPGYHYCVADSARLAAGRPSMRRFVARVLASRLPSIPLPLGRRLARPFTLADEVDDVARAYGKLCARGCKTLIVNGSGDTAVQALERHLGPGNEKALGERNLETTLVAGADHTFTPRIAQKRLGDLVLRLCADVA